MILDFISQYIDLPPQYEFIVYLLAAAVLLSLFLICVDFFASLIFAIFRRR